MRIKTSGFTLVEQLVALAIVGILATLAIPVYTKYVTKTHRTEGQIALLSLASNLEQYYSENHSYSNVDLAKLKIDPITSHGLYKLAITQASENSYVIQAIPQNSQAKNDLLCKTLTLNELGQKSQTGQGTLRDCWG